VSESSILWVSGFSRKVNTSNSNNTPAAFVCNPPGGPPWRVKIPGSGGAARRNAVPSPIGLCAGVELRACPAQLSMDTVENGCSESLPLGRFLKLDDFNDLDYLREAVFRRLRLLVRYFHKTALRWRACSIYSHYLHKYRLLLVYF
jgi:hypothetical protein